LRLCCGDYAAQDLMLPTNTIDMAGQRVGKFRVVGFATGTGHGARWLCQCECGSTRVYLTANLRRWQSITSIDSDFVVACEDCKKRECDARRVARTRLCKTVGPHFVPADVAPVRPREPQIKCSLCCGMSWRRRGVCPECKGEQLPERRVRAESVIGSAGAVCLAGIG
jgi:hypothetical protein